MLDRLKSIQFVMIVSFISSLMLSFMATFLKPSIDNNIELDKKKSLLKSIGIDVIAPYIAPLFEAFLQNKPRRYNY